MKLEELTVSDERIIQNVKAKNKTELRTKIVNKLLKLKDTMSQINKIGPEHK